LRLIEDLELVPAKYFKKLVRTNDIWECRIESGSNAYRIFCFLEKGNVIVLTHGLMKKTEKTPQSDIERAEQCRKDYFSRRK
jgi:phage-related protein